MVVKHKFSNWSSIRCLNTKTNKNLWTYPHKRLLGRLIVASENIRKIIEMGQSRHFETHA